MSELNDRFEQLASRGNARGVDAVLDAARADADQPEVALHAPAADVESHPSDAPTDADAVPLAAMDLPSVTRAPRRRRFGAAIAAMGLAATLFVGTLAMGAFFGGGGGSDSPEGAVRQLADAVSHEDAIAAADVLAPEEIRSLSGTVDAASRKAQELELARSANAPLDGLDLSVDGLSLSSESLADGYTKVTVNGGTLSLGTDSSRFAPAIQRALHDRNPDGGSTDLATLAQDQHLPTFVVTVQRGGHWYVSAAYTVLEYVREINDLPAAEFGSGLRAAATIGADSPEAAVTEAFRALSTSDWEKLISLAPPDEIPVYDYRAALVALAQDNDTDTSFTIDRIDTATQVNGDTAKVQVQASGSTEAGAWSLDGSCFTPPGGWYEGIEGYEGGQNTDHTSCGTGSTGFALPYFGFGVLDAADGAATTVNVVRKDGRWFVSPVGTVLDVLDRTIDHMTRREMYTSLRIADRLPPDGALTLGTPVTLPGTDFGARVYTYDGHAGEHLLGQTTGTPRSSDQTQFASVEVFKPDGNLMRNSYGLLYGESTELPTDGTYLIVVYPYGQEITFTLWDEANAPDAVKHPANAQDGQGCEYLGDGGVRCSSSGSSFSGDSSSGSSSSSSSSETEVTPSPTVMVDGGQSATTSTSVVSGTGG